MQQNQIWLLDQCSYVSECSMDLLTRLQQRDVGAVRRMVDLRRYVNGSALEIYVSLQLAADRDVDWCFEIEWTEAAAEVTANVRVRTPSDTISVVRSVSDRKPILVDGSAESVSSIGRSVFSSGEQDITAAWEVS
jgi:hypothetical protein